MNVVAVVLAWIGHTDLYKFLTEEDGPVLRHDYLLYAKGADGKVYIHNVTFRWWEAGKAERLLERVNALGRINPKHWHEAAKQQTYEEWCNDPHAQAREQEDERDREYAPAEYWHKY